MANHFEFDGDTIMYNKDDELSLVDYKTTAELPFGDFEALIDKIRRQSINRMEAQIVIQSINIKYEVVATLPISLNIEEYQENQYQLDIDTTVKSWVNEEIDILNANKEVPDEDKITAELKDIEECLFSGFLGCPTNRVPQEVLFEFTIPDRPCLAMEVDKQHEYSTDNDNIVDLLQSINIVEIDAV